MQIVEIIQVIAGVAFGYSLNSIISLQRTKVKTYLELKKESEKNFDTIDISMPSNEIIDYCRSTYCMGYADSYLKYVLEKK